MREVFRGGSLKVLTSRYFYYFVAAHAILSLGLYIGLAETGAIRYDSVLTALIIAISPSALLRTNVIETAQGKAIGLEHFYRQAISSVDQRLMIARYQSLQARVNIITYHNSLSVMRRALLSLYANHRSPKERARLFEQLSTELTTEDDYFRKRRICARHLLHQLDWETLKAEGFVPRGWDKPNPIDPQLEIRAAAKFCQGRTEQVQAINEMVEDWDKPESVKTYMLSEGRIAQLSDFLKYEKKEVMNPEGELNVNIRFLTVLRGFDIDRLMKDIGFTEDEVKEFREKLEEQVSQPEKKESMWSRFTGFFRRKMPDVEQPEVEQRQTVADRRDSAAEHEDPDLKDLKEAKTAWESEDSVAENGAKKVRAGKKNRSAPKQSSA